MDPSNTLDEGRRRPLTLVEELIVASDRPTAPVTIGLVAATTTRLDPRRLDAAVAGAVAAHPVVAARLTVEDVGAIWFTPRHARIDVVEVDCDSEAAVWDALARGCSYSFTPESKGQLRVILARRSRGDSLLLAAHHAAMDGRSLAILLRLILRRYEGLDSFDVDHTTKPGRRAASAPPPETSAAAPVGGAATPASPPPQAPPKRCPRTRLALAARIAPDRANNPLVTWIRRRLVTQPTDDCYGVHCVTIDVPQLRPLPNGAQPTVNDALVAAAHLAVERWNASRHGSTSVVHTRAATDQRTATERQLVANVSGEIMVTSRPADRCDPVRLLVAVWRQTATAKAAPNPRRQPAEALRPLCLLPPRARARALRTAVAVGRRLLMPTATVTNLGRIEDPLAGLADGPTVTSVHFAAFAGPPQGVMIGAAGFGNRLHLTFSHHTSMLDARAARRFAAVYLDALGDVDRGRSRRIGRQPARRAGVSGPAAYRPVPTR